MAYSQSFEWVCAELESTSSLNELEARGTVRLALKEAGLEPTRVTPEQMTVVATRILPAELHSRGLEDADGICRTLASGLNHLEAEPATESPEEVFERLSR